VLVVFFTLIIAAPTAHAGGTSIANTTITLDQTAFTSHAGSTPTLSWSQTTDAGSNLILIAGVASSNDGDPVPVSSITYGSIPLTLVVAQQVTSPSCCVDVEIWQLSNPDVSPGLGSHSIMVTFSVGPDNGAFGGSGTFFGVGGVRGSASAQALSVFVPFPKTATGDLLIDAVGADTGGSSSSLTPDSSQTKFAATSSPLGGFSAGTSGKGAGSGFTMSWTSSGSSDDPAIVAVSLIPLSAPIPEYPWGLPLLAILMLLSYGLVKRRVQTKQIR